MPVGGMSVHCEACMASHLDPSPTDRLIALLDHLGIGAAFVATQIPSDIAELAVRHPERMAGIILCMPNQLDPLPFAGIEDRLLMIAGESGRTAGIAARVGPRMPGSECVILKDYDALTWSDVVADRTTEIVDQMLLHLHRCVARGRAADRPKPPGTQGDYAGISYRITGSGPALCLLPFFLAPSQWAPAIPALAEHFTCITLGGRHLGGVAALEDRARSPTYRAIFRTLIDFMAPRPGDAILDVGCGAGSLDRLLAQRLGGANSLTAVDVNPFLLGEAAALAAADGLGSAIAFSRANAEKLPFPANSFDCLFSVTVLEECDADRAMAEMMRVVKPGGRIGIIVRAVDMRQWWSIEVPEAMRKKIEEPPRSVSPKGVADASLYRRMRNAGLRDLICFPSLTTLDRPDGPMWRFREDNVLSLFTPEETTQWRAARDAAKEEGLLFTANPMHCAVGVKP
jgi:SAM-dependent methyltransferase